MFCLVCALQYLSMSARAWSRCPLCFEPVYAQALKSFSFRLQRQQPAVGEPLQLALIMRDKQSAQLQLSAADDGSGDADAAASDPTLFSRFSFTADISAVCQRELMELALTASQHRAAVQSQQRAVADEEDAYLQFVLMAQQAVQRRLELWLAEHPDSSQQVRAVLARAHAVRQRQQAEQEERAAAQQRAERDEKERRRLPVRAAAASSPPLPHRSDDSVWPTLPTARPIRTLQHAPLQREPAVAAEPTPLPAPAADDAGRPADDSSAPPEDEPKAESQPACRPRPSSAFPVMDPELSYLFYQAADGQPVFLHSLCYRALLLEHETAGRLPARIAGRVGFLDELRMDAAQRRRLRFLSHLPLTAAFSIVALRLDDIVSAPTAARLAAEWSDELQARQRRQTQRQHDARRQQRRSEQRHAHDQRQQQQPAFASLSPASPSLQSAFAQAAYDSAVLDDEAEATDAGAQSVSFPALPPPASAAPPPPSPPAVRLTAWNTVAHMGMAASTVWAPLAAASSSPTAASQTAAATQAQPSSAWSRALQRH